MKKSELYLQTLDNLISQHINVTKLNSDAVTEAIRAATEWHSNQQIMKKPPLNRRNMNYYVYLVACRLWLDYLLSTNRQNKFESYKDLENFVFQFLSQVGWKTSIVGYDSIIVALMAEYAPKLKAWWQKQ